MSRFQPPRGTRDFMPGEMVRRNYVIDVIRRVFENFGFQPVDTPAFESWELFSKKGGGGDEIKNEIYYFRDKSERELGLRFDLTVPLARVVASKPNMQLPFKRYQVGKVWRYDRPQAGRMREFMQMDPDIVGTAKMDADTECMAAAVESLKQLGFKRFALRLNNRKILNGLIESVKIPPRKTADVLRILDKLEKISRNEIISELKRTGIGSDKITKLMKLIEVRGAPAKTLAKAGKLLPGIKTAEEGLRELQEIVSLSKSYGLDKYIVIDLSLVRGLDYYTGPIFEISVQTKKNVGSVAGGGRYDKLIELFGGKPMPATGISFGIERIYEIMSSEKMFDLDPSTTRVFVASVNEDVKRQVIEVAQKLRNSGINAETELMGRDLRKQLDYVNRRQIPYAVIVGPKEIKSKKFKVKDMKTGHETSLNLDKMVKKLK
jgi:histidyl-tRNA synthetase